MNNNINLGNMTSRQIGNLMTKPLVDQGKELINNTSQDQKIDYGELPSRALPNLEKQAVNNQINQQ